MFIKYGNFYKCFDNDFYIINKNSFGFKVNAIDKVLSILKDNNISCIVINIKINNINFN